MNRTEEPDQTYPRKDKFEDEIELIDYLRVLWKWKWLIIGGTFLCVLAAAIYGFTRPVVKTYKVSALIEIDPKAKLDPLDRIKSMIEYGIYNQQVLNGLSNLQGISKPGSLAFDVVIPKGLNILDIAYKTPNPDLGKAILGTLIKQLEQEYKEKIDQAKYQFDETIKKKSESIKNVQANIQQIKLAEGNKISGLKSNIENIQANIQHTKLESDNKISKLKSDIKNVQANIQQIGLGEGSKISRLQSKIKDIQANTQIIGKEFEKNRMNKENAIRTHTANSESFKENIRVVKSTIEQMEKVFQEAQLDSEKLAAQREAIVLDSKDKRGHEDIFMQAAAIQQIINYPVMLRNQINTLKFKEKEFLRAVFSESNTMKDLEAQIQILEMQKNDSLQREQDKIKDLEAQIQLLEMQKSGSIQREQDKIRDLEAQIQILEMQKDGYLVTEQNNIKDLASQIQLIELRANQDIAVEVNTIAVLESEIEIPRSDRDKITGVMVKQPPTASLLPDKYKAKRNAFLAGVVGFFLMVFFAFFIEYINNASQRTQKAV